jgi:hypothetical protein
VALLAPAASPSTLSGLVELPGGVRQVTGLGLPGLSYVLEATTNLNPPILWLPVLTNTANENGVCNFIDSDSTNFPIRFYRVKSQ